MKTILAGNVDKPKFPSLMIANDGMVILATNYDPIQEALKGTIVHKGQCKNYEIGHYSIEWSINAFKPLPNLASITLIQE